MRRGARIDANRNARSLDRHSQRAGHAPLHGPVDAGIQTCYQRALNAAGVTASSDSTYQGADCLYLIVTMGLEENDILENFQQGDIGSDPKNPKMLCFLDTWGNPIQFLRWAPGFNSPLQPAQFDRPRSNRPDRRLRQSADDVCLVSVDLLGRARRLLRHFARLAGVRILENHAAEQSVSNDGHGHRHADDRCNGEYDRHARHGGQYS